MRSYRDRNARAGLPYSNWPTTDRRRRRAKGASQDARRSTGYGAPLTAHFNRNFRNQEIDGELRRPFPFEPAAGGRHRASASIFDAEFDRRGKATRSLVKFTVAVTPSPQASICRGERRREPLKIAIFDGALS
jgi:hypothetical protein